MAIKCGFEIDYFELSASPENLYLEFEATVSGVQPTRLPLWNIRNGDIPLLVAQFKKRFQVYQRQLHGRTADYQFLSE